MEERVFFNLYKSANNLKQIQWFPDERLAYSQRAKCT